MGMQGPFWKREARPTVCKRTAVGGRVSAGPGWAGSSPFFHGFDRAAGGLPVGESAADVADGIEAHFLHLLCGEGGAPAQSAVEHEFFVRAKDVVVIRAFRIYPERQHATRGMKRAGNFALAPELVDIAQVDEQDALVIQQR